MTIPVVPVALPSNSYRTDIARIGVIDRIGVMLTDRTEFPWHAAAGPEQFDTMTGTTFGANAFRRFLAEADGLNAFNSLPPFLYKRLNSILFNPCNPNIIYFSILAFTHICCQADLTGLRNRHRHWHTSCLVSLGFFFLMK